MTAHGYEDSSLARMSPAATEAMGTYIKEAGASVSPSIRDRASRVVGTLALFAPNSFSERAFDAAALQTVTNHLSYPGHPHRYRAAGIAIADYFTDPRFDRPLKANNYVGTLLGDMPHIVTAADGYKRRIAEEAPAKVNRMLSGGEEISQDVWGSLRVGVNIPELARVTDTTNVESELARAALAADYLFSPPDDDQKIFENVLRAETLYAPLLEVYGLHAFDMMLQSNASKLRVQKAGHEDVLEHARDVLERAKAVSVEDIMYKMFGERPNEHLFQTAKESIYDETIVFSSTALSELHNGVEEGELHARFKTVGKYARKLLHNPNYNLESEALPLDTFGMLAVVPDEKSLSEFFGYVTEKVLHNDSIELLTAPSKQMPLYVQGSPRFVQSVCETLPYEVVRLLQVADNYGPDVPETDIFQVAKFTCMMKFGNRQLPVEFQFQTEADRVNARLGNVSHMSHNSGEGLAANIPASPRELKAMFRRRDKVDSRGEEVNPKSIPHGEELRRQIEQALSAPELH